MARKSRKHLQNTSENQKILNSQRLYRAAVYVRTSSEDQKGNSIENQIRIVEEFIQVNSDIKLHKIYSDYGFSSFSRYRPRFEDLLFDIESKTINCIIVKDISRFSRDYLEAGDFIQKKFPIWGIRFISINDNLDTLHDDVMKIGIVLNTLLYNHYSIELSKKIQSTIKNMQIEGCYVPAKLPYGYVKIKTEKGIEWGIHEKKASIIRYIFKSTLDGLSAYAIAGKLNKQNISAPNSDFWTSGSILRILRNVSYTGVFITGKTQNNSAIAFKTMQIQPENQIRHDGHHPPIVNESTFNLAQHILSERSSLIISGKKVEDFFLGKLYCGICGRKMRPKHSSNGCTYYICPRKDESTSSCTNKAKSEAKLKSQVFFSIVKKIKLIENDYQELHSYESSPYFHRETSEQDRLLQLYKNEFEQKNQLFQWLYEDSVNKCLTGSIDQRELMKYMRNIRSVLQEKIATIEQSAKDYLEMKTLKISMFERYLQFQNCHELTTEMLEKVVQQIYVDLDGVRVV